MTTYGTLANRRRALQAAASTLDDLKLDQGRPIDVFDAIGQLGAWLTFVRLKNLLGTYVPEGTGGVMITTERQPSVQRYTAAHEIGHLVLDHRLSLDGEDEVLRPTVLERERLAQLFASYFIMPPPLVYATAARYGIQRGREVNGTQAYLASRDMRVSYEAVLRQLSELSLITHTQRDSLFAIAPLDIKRALGHGVRPVNGYADVWPVDERSNGIHLDVMVDDEVVVALPENPTTGFRWLDESGLAASKHHVRRDPPPPFGAQLASTSPASGAPSPVEPSVGGAEVGTAPSAGSAEESPLQRVADQYAPGWTEIDPRRVRSMRRSIAARATASHVATTPAATPGSQAQGGAAAQAMPGVGGTGRRWLHLQAEVTGTWSYVLQYASPYDPMSKPVSTFTIEATVRPAPVSENRRRLLEVDLDDDSPSPLGRGI